MIKESIAKLVIGKDLDFQETKTVFEEIFDHRAGSSQIAAFLTALKMKGENEAEILAAATVIRSRAVKIKLDQGFLEPSENRPLIDTCGTGGSGLNKFNISTAVAFVVAAADVLVAKHGNKAMSSSCGSADVLEALGINIMADPAVMKEALKTVGIAFLYAPLYHPALKEVAQIRKEIGIRTIFNILGPLCNPAGAEYQLLGVYSSKLAVLLARVLKQLGLKRGLVVYGKDLKDEISLSGPTQGYFLNKRKITKLTLSASTFGLKKVVAGDLLVNSPAESAQVISQVLAAKKGPCRDIVLANASACFYVLGKVSNFKQGVSLAGELIDSGKAKAKYRQFRDFLKSHA